MIMESHFCPFGLEVSGADAAAILRAARRVGGFRFAVAGDVEKSGDSMASSLDFALMMAKPPTISLLRRMGRR
jgi:hypothetical protein